jgi:hypothetical protein
MKKGTRTAKLQAVAGVLFKLKKEAKNVNRGKQS